MAQIKYSRQREALLNELRATTSHPTADELYEKLRLRFPSISLATVYRNLRQLNEEGIILKLDVGFGAERFDATTTNHYHLVCKTCDKVFDVNLKELDNIKSIAEKATGAKIDFHTLLFYGKCKACNMNK